MNFQDAREQGQDINYFWYQDDDVLTMDQPTLGEYADYLGILPNETFEEAAIRCRDEGDEERSRLFLNMEERWQKLES